MSKVTDGSRVKVHYTGKLEDGTMFDSSVGGEPLEFTIGKGQVIKGLEDAIIGMSIGDNKNITINPENGYGSRRDELILEIDRDKMPENIELQVGNRLSAKNDDNTRINMVIVEVTENIVTLDANHPLADKILIFDIELIDVDTNLN